MDDQPEVAVTQQPSQQMTKIKQTQEEIAKVTEQMHHNIDMIQERGERLENLQDKSDKLQFTSQRFKTQATTVRRQMWWKNLKWTICIGVLVVIVIAGAVGGGVRGHQYWEEHKTVTDTQTMQSQTAASTPTAV